MEERKLNWKKTGKEVKELSENGGGIVTLAEERAGKRTRLVPIAYQSKWSK